MDASNIRGPTSHTRWVWDKSRGKIAIFFV